MWGGLRSLRLGCQIRETSMLIYPRPHLSHVEYIQRPSRSAPPRHRHHYGGIRILGGGHVPVQYGLRGPPRAGASRPRHTTAGTHPAGRLPHVRPTHTGSEPSRTMRAAARSGRMMTKPKIQPPNVPTTETVRTLYMQTAPAIRPIQEAHDHLTGALLADPDLPEPVRAR